MTKKMTEDEVVLNLIKYLEEKGWEIGNRFCLGSKHGIDIEAHRNGKTLLIEAKGARANDKAPSKKREYFNSGQIKTHFGAALVKILNDKVKNPNAIFAIAHPDDDDIKKVIGHLIPFLHELHITHYWVSTNKILEQ